MAVGVVLDPASHSGMQNQHVLDTHHGMIKPSEWKLNNATKNSATSDEKVALSLNQLDSDPKLPTRLDGCEAGTEAVSTRCEKTKPISPSVSEFHHRKRGDWCASMVCYIWFAQASRLPMQQERTGNKRKRCETQIWSSRKSLHRPALSMNLSSSSQEDAPSKPSQIQVCPTEHFVSFVVNILRTTQVSQSVVIVSLYYIYRLKTRRAGLVGQPGSEYRLFLISLILANKFLDDYTYTNKTWADLSNTPLKEVTKMELQMYAGIGANANVTPSDYAWWCTALKGLKQQRDIDLQWLHSRNSAAYLMSPPLSWSVTESPISTPLEPILPPSISGQPSVTSSITLPEMPGTNKRKLSWPTMNEKEKDCVYNWSSPITSTPALIDNGLPSGSLQLTRTVSSNDWNNKSKALWHSGPHVDTGRAESAPRQSLPVGIISSATDAQHSVPSHIDARDVISHLHSGDRAVGSLQSKPMLDMELFGPYHHLSPPFVNQPTTSTSPIVLGYYRLAAGHPYGIPTWTNVGAIHNRPFFAPHPIFESSKFDINMSFSPPCPDGVMTAGAVPHFQPPMTHFPELWPVAITNIPCGNGSFSVRNENDNEAANIPLQSLTPTGFPDLNLTGVTTAHFVQQP